MTNSKEKKYEHLTVTFDTSKYASNEITDALNVKLQEYSEYKLINAVYTSNRYRLFFTKELG